MLKSGGCGSIADVAACEGLDDGDPCTSGFGAGWCLGGACRASMCGNGEIEGTEVCDDGNLQNGDGCNGTCTSDETCGNGISELLEACDPDCWTYCTPACPALTSCAVTTTPSCGDGECDEPRENALRCPADCP